VFPGATGPLVHNYKLAWAWVPGYIKGISKFLLFALFQSPMVYHSPKYYMKNSRNKQFLSFILAYCSEVMNLDLFAWDMKSSLYPVYPHCIFYSHTLVTFGSLGYQISCLKIIELAFNKPLFYLIMVPKHKTSDASSLVMPKRSHKVFSTSKKAKALNLIRKGE
jgi:hypothetical protein